MGTKKRSEVSSDRLKWEKVFNALVDMLQTQQSQLENLAKERKLLEDRIRMQHDRWVSDIRIYEDRISEMEGDFVVQDMTHKLELTKCDLVTILKQREAVVNKLKLDQTDSELADFRAWFDYLSHKTSDAKGEERRSKILEGKVRTLRCEYEKLASEKSSEVTALMVEKKFVWNQYKIMENDYSSKLSSKQSEAELANQKIRELLGNIEQLQSLNDEKDETIARLENKVANIEADKNKLNEETSRLSQELHLLRKSRSASVTPVLNRCMAGGKNSGKDRSNIIVKKESSAAQLPYPVKDTVKGGRSLKRKGVDVTPISETPSLFSSSFKVPKLKGGRSLKRKGVDVTPISETPSLFSSSFKVPKLKAHIR